MRYLSDLEFQKRRTLESWEIFKITGEICDAMEMMDDLRCLDAILEEDSLER